MIADNVLKFLSMKQKKNIFCKLQYIVIYGKILHLHLIRT